jgi:predicted transglutaminase-like cysteine proteinase
MAQALLIENIVNMIFVSINPFALKRFFFFLLAAIGLSCVSCFGQSILLSVRSTPYDKQMSRVRPVLTSEAPHRGSEVSLGVVNQWIGDLRSIPYGFTKEWKTPLETQSGSPADCKAKALALYDRMQIHGATNLRLIIGKRAATSRSTHAWLEWDTATGTYVLDPTINWTAYQGRDVGRRSYIPFYAFEGTRKFRAAPATLVTQN